MLKSLKKTAIAAVAATSLLMAAGASHAVTFNPTNDIVSGGSYDIAGGPYAFGVFFERADNATKYTFNFFNSSSTTSTVGVTLGTVLQAFSNFANGVKVSWANGESAFIAKGDTKTFSINTVLAANSSDKLILQFSDPRGKGNPGLQMNVAAVSAVPLPAGGLLLLGALGGIAMLRRRKAV